LSDGREDFRSAERAVLEARQLGIPIDTIPLAGRPQPELRMEADLPDRVFRGERFPLDITLSSPRAAAAEVLLSADGKPIAATRVSLAQGSNHIRLNTSMEAAGPVEVTITVRAEGMRELRHSQPMTVRQPRVLLVSGEPLGSSGAVQRHCVVVVLEKSVRMDGAKLELAKLAAAGLIENLRRTDLVGVLAFDDGFRWLIPIRKASERDPIDHSIDGLTAGGGVRIAAALREALRGLRPVRAGFKHIVLLTDGVSQDAGALALAREAAAEDVTVSAISIGEDQNRRYLSRLVRFSQGASLFLRDPSGLEKIVAVHGGKPLLVRRQNAQGRAVAYDADSPQEPLLRWISESTGGRFNPSPSGIFDPDGRTVAVFLPLWPALVLFALGWTLFGMIPKQSGTHRDSVSSSTFSSSLN
jgi:Mg-chelatase subunit ChlD